MIKAIFLDIDGTLVSFKTHKVSQSTVHAIETLRANGIKVFVATGRMLSMTSVLDGIEFDGYIAYNGSCCTDGAKNVIFKHTIPQKELDALVSRLQYDKFPVSFMCRDEMFVNYLDPVVIKVASIVNVEPPIVKNPYDIIKEDIYQLCIYLDDRRMDTIIKEVLPDCSVGRWIPEFADVNMRGVNKSLGMEKILEYYDIKRDETMAFGDGGNDIPMIEYAAIGIAMGNSSQNVINAADYVTATVDNEGVPKALKHFKLL